MYFVPINPGSNEQSTYNRFAVAFVFTTRTIRWQWQYTVAGVNTRARLLVDGEPATGMVAPVNGIYTFDFMVENGHHVATPELETGTCFALSKPFVVNDTGVPLPEQNPWVALTRLEATVRTDPEQVAYTPARPFAAKMKSRVIEPYSTRLSKDRLWARRWTHHQRNAMTRRFERTKQGDVIVVPEQKYSYGNAISLGEFKAGLVVPQTVCRDGPRNWGHFRYIGKLLLRRSGKGLYFLETNGRIGFMQFGAFSRPPR